MQAPHALQSKFSTYPAARAEADRLWAAHKVAGEALAQFPKGPLGLTPDHIKASPAYQAASAAADRAHADLRAFNAWYVPAFKKERAAEREARVPNSLAAAAVAS